jgi:hypothetical protein
LGDLPDLPHGIFDQKFDKIQTETLPTIRTRHVPQTEIKMTLSGALLVAGEPRYSTLEEFILQFGAPRSSLPGAGMFSFSDPVFPELTLLVLTEPADCCTRCQLVLGECQCPF